MMHFKINYRMNRAIRPALTERVHCEHGKLFSVVFAAIHHSYRQQ